MFFTAEEWIEWEKKHKFRTFIHNSTLPFRVFKLRLKELYCKVKWGFQRMFRGYDNPDSFDLCYNFLEKYTKILKQFRKWGNSYPSKFDSYEEWAKILDEMICYFELSDEFNEYVWDEEEPYNFKDSIYRERLAYYYGNKALAMFNKYFWDLWD